MAATIEPTHKSLEIRINSVTDAKACVQHHESIFREIKRGGYDSVELMVAEEIDRQVDPYLAGLFRVRLFRKKIKCANGNTLFQLPVLRDTQARTAAVVQKPVTVIQNPPGITGKRRGRPPKVKVQNG